MSTQLVMQGTVKPDGRLELDERVPMPAGRVLVTVEPVVQPPANDPFWMRMHAIWQAQNARGHMPRTREQIDAEVNALRDEAEEELRETERVHEYCQQTRKKVEEHPE
jgi:hypothetical protein